MPRGTKLTIKDAQKLSKNRGGKCLSNEYKVGVKLQWQCDKEHVWKANYYDIKQLGWCPYCAINKKKTIKDAQKLASDKGGKCLSNDYINSQTKMKWECDKKHIFIKTYAAIQQGKWCLYCAGKKYKYHTLEECRGMAKEKDGECLSTIYINSKTKMTWRCKNNHIWNAAYSDICFGYWCQKCTYINNKNTINDSKELAKSQNGKCLSTIYINSKTKMTWRCKNKHV